MFNLTKKENNTTHKLLQEAITSIVGEDVNINGDLISNTSIRIDGKVMGNVTAQKLIIVGKNAEIKGDLSCKNVIVFGKLIGSVTAAEVQIKKTGTIHGDISVQAIEIEMGGKYNGSLMMNAEQRELNERQKAKEAKSNVLID